MLSPIWYGGLLQVWKKGRVKCESSAIPEYNLDHAGFYHHKIALSLTPHIFKSEVNYIKCFDAGVQKSFHFMLCNQTINWFEKLIFLFILVPTRSTRYRSNSIPTFEQAVVVRVLCKYCFLALSLHKCTVMDTFMGY